MNANIPIHPMKDFSFLHKQKLIKTKYNRDKDHTSSPSLLHLSSPSYPHSLPKISCNPSFTSTKKFSYSPSLLLQISSPSFGVTSKDVTATMQDADFFTKSGKLHPLLADAWLGKTACVSDMEYFIKNVSVIKGKDAVRPDLIGSIITHFASKWIPELGDDSGDDEVGLVEESSPESVTVSWTRKKFFIESLVQILPPEKDSVPCNFLLRLLRVANMVQVDPVCCAEVERRVSWLLDQASLKELMIPCFSHTATTLLDVNLVLRLVRMFVGVEDVSKSGASVVKVTKLIDSYLAEAAVDSCLTSNEFIELACVMPSHARAIDDGLYRAIDTFLKAHPSLPKQDRKSLCKLIDSHKLSPDASLHASQNERLPVRAVIRLLLSEQAKFNNNKHLDWSGSLNGIRSPAFGLDLPARCLSKRETPSTIQNIEIKRLKEDVQRLQIQCTAMEKKIEKLLEKKRFGTMTTTTTSTSYFSWKRFGIVKAFKGRSGNKFGENDEEGIKTIPAKFVRTKSIRRRSMS